jgi:hypothetical protein
MMPGSPSLGGEIPRERRARQERAGDCVRGISTTVELYRRDHSWLNVKRSWVLSGPAEMQIPRFAREDKTHSACVENGWSPYY